MIDVLCGGRRRSRRAVLVGVLCAILVIVAAAVAASATVGSPMPTTTIAAGTVSQIHTLTRVVVREQAAWTDLWRRHTGRADAPPAVDFDRDMVAAVFAGDSPEPIAVGIARIARESNRVVVSYTLAATRRCMSATTPPMSRP